MTQTASDPFFISLGAGKHQIPLIQAAVRLGFRVIGIDKSPDAPGLYFCNIRRTGSAADSEFIIRELKKLQSSGYRFAGILSRSFAGVSLAAAETAKALNLAGPSPESVLFFHNKIIYKNKLKEAEVIIPRQFTWENSQSRDQFLNCGVPVIVKPASGHGKSGITLLRNREEISEFIRNTPDDGSLLAEEMINGKEVTVLASVFKKTVFIHSVTDKITSSEFPLFSELLHRHPSRFADSGIISSIQEQLQITADISGLDESPLVAEFLISDRGVFLVEAAPEIGGEYLADRLFPAVTGSDYFEYLINKLTNQKADPVSVLEFPEKSCVIGFIPPTPGKKAAFPDYISRIPECLFYEILHPANSPDLRGNAARMAVAGLISGVKNTEELEKLLSGIFADSFLPDKK